MVEKVQKFSNIHVIGHLEGICHIYVDKSSNLEIAKKLIINAKMRRTSICGAVETLLIEEKALKSHAKKIILSLLKSGCEVRVDSKINKLFNKPLSIANSSGTFIGKAFHLNYIRPGKSLYGINPFLKKSFGLKGGGPLITKSLLNSLLVELSI